MEQQGKPLSEEELKNIELRTELFNRYILPNKNLVYRLCIRYTYLQEDIADNYSEALVNFFKYITTYDPQRCILNWIHIVTKRFVMEQNRRHGRLPVSENVNVYSLASSLRRTTGNSTAMTSSAPSTRLNLSTGKPSCSNRRATSWRRSSRFHIATAT